MSLNSEPISGSQINWFQTTFGRLVVIGLVAAICNGLLLRLPFYRGTYDAYTHIFFAMHYKAHWIDSWDPRWFGGYDLAAYPPLAHQVIALLSYAFDRLTSYRIVIFSLFPVFSWGVFRFSRIWLDENSAFHAGLASIFLTSIAQAAYHWGQLPTFFSIAFMMHGLAYTHTYLLSGKIKALLMSLLCLIVCVTAHHISVVFCMPLLFISLAWPLFWNDRRDVQRTHQITLIRCVIFAFAAVVVVATMFSPFLFYIARNKFVQVPIFHASRSNFLENFNAFVLFFVIPWGAFLFFIPGMLPVISNNRRLLGLGVVTSFFAICGVGGTIPGVNIILGPMFSILTLERFTLWATIAILPFVGYILAKAQPRITKAVLYASLISTYVGFFWWLGNYKFQPDSIPMKPLATYLDRHADGEYRYLTLGFGSQMAWLGALTKSGSVDGLYFTVRSNPVLRSSGIEALDGAKYYGDHGLDVLLHFLKFQDRYSLKYIFNADPFYEDLLQKTGWSKSRTTFGKSVVLWEKPETPKIPIQERTPRSNMPQWLLWIRSSYPLFFFLCVICGIYRLVRTSRDPISNTPDNISNQNAG